jgi:hypothetical protein
MSLTQKILEQAALLLKKPTFIAKHRVSPTAFIRRRKLSFDRIAGTLIHLVKNSLQIVCNKLGEYFQMDSMLLNRLLAKPVSIYLILVSKTSMIRSFKHFMNRISRVFGRVTECLQQMVQPFDCPSLPIPWPILADGIDEEKTGLRIALSWVEYQNLPILHLG